MTDCAITTSTPVRVRRPRRHSVLAGVPAWARFLGVVVVPVRDDRGSTGFVLSAGAGLTHVAAIVRDDELPPPSVEDIHRDNREDLQS